MATFSLETSVNTLPDTPVLPNFLDHPVVLAKIIDFSIFRDLDSREVVNSLKAYFNSKEMLVIACSESPQPVPLQQMTLEALEYAMTFTVKTEPQALLGDDNLNSFNEFKAAIEAYDEESVAAMDGILDLSYNCVLDAIATRTVKKGALYLCPFAQRPVLLLGNRSLFFTDKGRIKAAEMRMKKAAKKAAAGEKLGLPKDDSAFQSESRRKKQQSTTVREEGYVSNQFIEDVSCHGGDGDSPYPSEWEHNSQHSAPATPELHRERNLLLILKLLMFPSCLWLPTTYPNLLWDLLLMWLLPIFAWPLLLLSHWALLDLNLFLWDIMLLHLDWVGLWDLSLTLGNLMVHPPSARPRNQRARSQRNPSLQDPDLLLPPLLAPLRFPLLSHLLTRYWVYLFFIFVYPS